MCRRYVLHRMPNVTLTLVEEITTKRICGQDIEPRYITRVTTRSSSKFTATQEMQGRNLNHPRRWRDVHRPTSSVLACK